MITEFSPKIHVTGDVAKDVAIYQGDRIFPSEQGKIAPHLKVSLGGAALLYQMIKEANPGAAEFGFEDLDEANLFTDDLAVHSLWKPQPGGLKKEHKDAAKDEAPKDVWRVAESLGYALRPSEKPATPNLEKIERDSNLPPRVLVVDDGGLGFRNQRMSQFWPSGIRRKGPQPQWILYKLANPVAQGDLWRKLTDSEPNHPPALRDNLVIITSADELRRAGASVSRGFSWERTLTEICGELSSDSRFLPLLQRSRYLVINLGCVGSLLFQNSQNGQPHVTLIYDPTLAEGQFKQLMQDDCHGVYGSMSVFTSALALDLFEAGGKPANPENFLVEGIKRGLTGIRLLRLIGHGRTDNSPCPPCAEVTKVIKPGAQKLPESVELSKRVAPHGFRIIRKEPDAHPVTGTWMLAALEETPHRPQQPLFGLAYRFALQGDPAVLCIPHARFGALLSVDRQEMETLRSLRQMIEAYAHNPKSKRPLSLGAFGPPGAGKSFGIKQIAHEILGRDGEDAAILEFNLSQFSEGDPGALIDAFHQVRDHVLQGELPVVFWDEFDSKNYFWLQYLLAPMQDGAFQSRQLTHTLGKCIFVFAGATSWDFQHFGPVLEHAGPKEMEELEKAHSKSSELRQEDKRAHDDFRLKKGPDFVSRLDGHINVLGPNPRMCYDYGKRTWNQPDPTDITWPLRRAILLRSFLDAKKDKALAIDRDLLGAFLHVPKYRHGARSLEKIVGPLASARTPYRRAQLPPPQVLEQHLVTAQFFDDLHERNRSFLNPENLRRVAAAIHENYERLYDSLHRLEEADFLKAFDELSPWFRASNLAAAQRLPHVLAIAGLQVTSDPPKDATADWKTEICEHLEHHREVLAREEHQLWMEFHLDNGWAQITETEFEDLSGLPESGWKTEIKRLKEEERRHWLLLPFDELPEHPFDEPRDQREKDYDPISRYPDMVALIGCRIEFM